MRGRTEKKQHIKLEFGVHVVCPSCNGSGTRPRQKTEDCRTCEGRGYVRKEDV